VQQLARVLILAQRLRRRGSRATVSCARVLQKISESRQFPFERFLENTFEGTLGIISFVVVPFYIFLNYNCTGTERGSKAAHVMAGPPLWGSGAEDYRRKLSP
jgi:hypothetical protein